MIKIENVQVHGFDPAIRGMRNPKNSWDRSDSHPELTTEGGYFHVDRFVMGPNDYKLARNLAEAGNDHGKFLRYVWVYMDITAPLYWWKEFDTYKIGNHDDPYPDVCEIRDPDTVTNSCSTMHTLMDKPITMDDFSTEYVMDVGQLIDEGFTYMRVPKYNLRELLETIEIYRQMYNETENVRIRNIIKHMVVQMLPDSYNQKRTVMINYMTLKNIMKGREHHFLDEWRIFYKFMVERLPYINIIYAQRVSA